MADQARIIDGKAAAAALRAEIGREVAAIKAGGGLVPGLHVVLVGDDPASRVYVASKEKLAAEIGMNSVAHRLPAETSEAELLAKLAELNADDSVDGILVQLPLPQAYRHRPHHRRHRPGQGCRRPASDQCRPARRRQGRARALHAARLHAAAAAGPAFALGAGGGGDRPLRARRPPDRAIAAAGRLHGDDRAFAHARPAGRRCVAPISWWPRSAAPAWSRPTGSSPARR